jgi:hypothetical protein
MIGVLSPTNEQVEVAPIMRALDSEVGDAIWAGFEALLPEGTDNHPLGCHRHRVSDRDCFAVMLVPALVTLSTAMGRKSYIDEVSRL